MKALSLAIPKLRPKFFVGQKNTCTESLKLECCRIVINFLPNFFNLTKFKAYADDKLNVANMRISLFDTVQNTVEKGENAGYQHFLFSHSVFQSLFLQGC